MRADLGTGAGRSGGLEKGHFEPRTSAGKLRGKVFSPYGDRDGESASARRITIRGRVWLIFPFRTGDGTTEPGQLDPGSGSFRPSPRLQMQLRMSCIKKRSEPCYGHGCQIA